MHRYAPFPGGSEYYVQQMAEESKRRGHDVIVFTGDHQGDFNGIHVSSNPQMCLDANLVVIHGGDVGVQNFVLHNIKNLPGKVLYLLIKPSVSDVCVQGMKDAHFIGCSTQEDWAHVKLFGLEHKARKVTHGISPDDCIGTKGRFKDTFGIPKDKRMYISCGGYWPNKRMIELADTFRKAELDDAVLVTTGYDNRHNIMPHVSENVIPLMVEDPKDVKDAIADADFYIMNSDAEGFGLVLLESMLNKTPWISRNIAAAKMLSQYGATYETQDELIEILRNWSPKYQPDIAYNHVVKNYLISNTVDDIENVMKSQ